MRDGAGPAATALAVGLVLSFVLLVPYVAVQYRRRGELGLTPSVTGFAVLVYAASLVTYTLLPLPAVGTGFCADGGAAVQLRPGQFLTDITGGGPTGLGGLLRDRALQGSVLNVLLFVPLGAFLRHLTRRSVLVTVAAGLVVSTAIELTQLTGVWFLFPCSYRIFDVDDLLLNTGGALVGALLAPALRLLPGQRHDDPDRPRPVTAQRRLLGMLCDGVAALLLGLALSPTYALLGSGAVEDRWALGLPTLVPAGAQLVLLLTTRRTLGELVVRLGPGSRRGPGPFGAIVRWLVGIGGVLLLASTGVVRAGSETYLGTGLAVVLALALVVSAVHSDGHGGLGYRATGWRLMDDRTPAREAAPDDRWWVQRDA